MSDRLQWVNTDAEIHTISEDRLGRKKFCRRVVERIVAAGHGPSVVFGLAGPWGAGKTSVLNIVSDLLRLEHGDDWEVVHFTAWSASDVGTLTDEFYQAIAAAMPQDTLEGRQAVSWLLSMAPIAAAAGKAAAVSVIERKLGRGGWRNVSEATVGALADRLGKFQIQPDPFVARFEKLSKAIDRAGRNVVVVVDDIDRLHSDELLGVMKAVRLLGRFNRVHYLLSYDQQTVLDVLKASDIASGDEQRARQYLEKIVQYPFVLPPLQVAQVDAELTNVLQNVATFHQVQLEPLGDGQLGTISRIVHLLLDTHFEQLTLRRINRLGSQVEVLLTLVGANDLNFTDAVLVTFVRLWYPNFYDQLPRWRRDLVKDIRSQSNSATQGVNDESSRTYRIADALGIAPDRRTNNPELEAVMRLMDALFPGALQTGSMRRAEEPCRIDSSEYFDRYFALGIPVGDVSDDRVRTELTTLCMTGRLPDDSVILQMLASPQAASIVLHKLLRVVDVVDELPAGHILSGAAFLYRQLNEGDQVFGNWVPVINSLLGRAICSADDPLDVVYRFQSKFGLPATAEVLFAGGARRLDTDNAAILKASTSVTSSISEHCKLDLESDVAAEDPNALTCLHFLRLWASLPQDVISQLADLTNLLIKDNRAKAHELAGRFVRIPRTTWTRFPDDQPEFFSDEFETLWPRSKWVLDELPVVSRVEIDRGDGSLQNRIKFAASAMRKLLTSNEISDKS